MFLGSMSLMGQEDSEVRKVVRRAFSWSLRGQSLGEEMQKSIRFLRSRGTIFESGFVSRTEDGAAAAMVCDE